LHALQRLISNFNGEFATVRESVSNSAGRCLTGGAGPLANSPTPQLKYIQSSVAKSLSLKKHTEHSPILLTTKTNETRNAVTRVGQLWHCGSERSASRKLGESLSCCACQSLQPMSRGWIICVSDLSTCLTVISKGFIAETLHGHHRLGPAVSARTELNLAKGYVSSRW
jgi:hypothetical protein